MNVQVMKSGPCQYMFTAMECDYLSIYWVRSQPKNAVIIFVKEE